MRVLFVIRQDFGGMATYAALLADALDKEGVEAVVDDVTHWVPKKTGPAIDRKTNKILRFAVRGFDIVHAFGYRASWACSNALFREKPWLYTAHDMPKTVRSELIEHLNTARFGICSSEAAVNILGNAGAENLALVRPGLPMIRRLMDREECRGMLGVQEDQFLLSAAGLLVPEHDLMTLIKAMEKLPENVRLMISGKGGEEETLREAAGKSVEITTEPFAQQQILAASDLVVVPSTNAGFSFSAAEAMYQGVPALVRKVGGLAEMVTHNETGFTFESDEELADILGHLIHKSDQLKAVGKAAKDHVENAFDISRTAGEYADIYSQVLAR